MSSELLNEINRKLADENIKDEEELLTKLSTNISTIAQLESIGKGDCKQAVRLREFNADLEEIAALFKNHSALVKAEKAASVTSSDRPDVSLAVRLKARVVELENANKLFLERFATTTETISNIEAKHKREMEMVTDNVARQNREMEKFMVSSELKMDTMAASIESLSARIESLSLNLSGTADKKTDEKKVDTASTQSTTNEKGRSSEPKPDKTVCKTASQGDSYSSGNSSSSGNDCVQHNSRGISSAYKTITSSSSQYLEDSVMVIDNGGAYMKAGWASDDRPCSIFPSVVGRPKHPGIMVGMDQKDAYIGSEALSKRGVLNNKHPIECGNVTNWDDMEKLWEHTFYNELEVDPSEHAVLLSEAPFCPKPNRERTTQYMFELFNSPLMFLITTPPLSVYSTGKTTGLVISSGYDGTVVVPVYEGACLSNNAPMHARKLSCGGKDITAKLMDQLSNRGYSFTTTAERAIVGDVKEQLGYVALDYDREMMTARESSCLERSYELPDGNVLVLGDERFRCVEAMFNPSQNGFGSGVIGIQDMAMETIGKLDIDCRSDMYNNIHLSGGNMCFPGMKDRVFKEMRAKVPSSKKVSVSNESSATDVWLGASCFGALDYFRQMCISKAEYDESGPSIVHRKCCY